jgi:hypothetical protein
MPWTPAQHRLFEAAAHNPQIALDKGISQQQAASMAGEGIKRAKNVRLTKALTTTAPPPKRF